MPAPTPIPATWPAAMVLWPPSAAAAGVSAEVVVATAVAADDASVVACVDVPMATSDTVALDNGAGRCVGPGTLTVRVAMSDGASVPFAGTASPAARKRSAGAKSRKVSLLGAAQERGPVAVVPEQQAHSRDEAL